MAIQVTPDEFAAIMARAEDEILEAIPRMAERVGERLATAFRERNPVDTGHMRAAWNVNRSGDGAVVNNNAEYAAAVEANHPTAAGFVREAVENEAPGILAEEAEEMLREVF